MKDFGIQFNETGEIGDVKVDVIRDDNNMIVQGIVLGNTLQQNKAMLLIGSPGCFKQYPTLGVGLADALLGDDLLAYRHIIRREFARDGLNITRLDLYENKETVIEANY